jgi:hypothetical protein
MRKKYDNKIIKIYGKENEKNKEVYLKHNISKEMDMFTTTKEEKTKEVYFKIKYINSQEVTIQETKTMNFLSTDQFSNVFLKEKDKIRFQKYQVWMIQEENGNSFIKNTFYFF